MLSYNIHKRIKESDAKNVHHLFNAVTNDNYYLFNNLDNLESYLGDSQPTRTDFRKERRRRCSDDAKSRNGWYGRYDVMPNSF